MDTSVRMLLKSITWQASGLIVMTLVGFYFTGSLTAGGGIAVVGSLIGFAAYFLHELLWSKVQWGRSASQTPHS